MKNDTNQIPAAPDPVQAAPAAPAPELSQPLKKQLLDALATAEHGAAKATTAASLFTIAMERIDQENRWIEDLKPHGEAQAYLARYEDTEALLYSIQAALQAALELLDTGTDTAYKLIYAAARPEEPKKT